MAWNILVYVDEVNNHFKFWSYSSDNWVAWGRIGSHGTSRQFPESNIQRKVQSKLNEGYRVFAQEVDSQSPNSNDVRDFWDGNRPMNHSAPTHRITPTIQSSEEVQEEIADREITQAPPVRRRARTTKSESSQNYQTNKKGFIKKYRAGYNRPEQKNYKSYNKVNLFSSTTRVRKAKKFYDSVPATNMIKKREFGNEFESQQTHGRFSGKHQFVFDEEDKCVGFFEVSRDQSVNFLYIKTKEENKVGLLKFIISSISSLANDNEVVVRTKGSILKEAMKRTYEWSSSRTSSGVSTWKIRRADVLGVEDRGDRRYVETMW